MLIHQKAYDSHLEFWIELDQIRSIIKNDNESYKVYLIGCTGYYEINKETFNKIMEKKEVI